MNKFIPLCVLTLFLLSFSPLQSMEGLNNLQKAGHKDKQELKGDEKKVKEKKNAEVKTTKELQAKELKKKEIEAKEHSVNKNKPAKRFSTDDNIPETVRKRNIP